MEIYELVIIKDTVQKKNPNDDSCMNFCVMINIQVYNHVQTLNHVNKSTTQKTWVFQKPNN